MNVIALMPHVSLIKRLKMYVQVKRHLVFGRQIFLSEFFFIDQKVLLNVFSVKIFSFALTPVFSVDFFYNIHSS